MGITLSPWMMAFLVLMTGFAGFVDSLSLIHISEPTRH